MNDGCLNSVAVVKVNSSSRLKNSCFIYFIVYINGPVSPTLPARQREQWLSETLWLRLGIRFHSAWGQGYLAGDLLFPD